MDEYGSFGTALLLMSSGAEARLKPRAGQSPPSTILLGVRIAGVRDTNIVVGKYRRIRR